MFNDPRNIKNDLHIKLEANLEFSRRIKHLLEQTEDDEYVLHLYEDWGSFLRYLLTLVETAEQVKEVTDKFHQANSEIARLLNNYSQ